MLGSTGGDDGGEPPPRGGSSAPDRSTNWAAGPSRARRSLTSRRSGTRCPFTWTNRPVSHDVCGMAASGWHRVPLHAPVRRRGPPQGCEPRIVGHVGGDPAGTRPGRGHAHRAAERAGLSAIVATGRKGVGADRVAGDQPGRRRRPCLAGPWARPSASLRLVCQARSGRADSASRICGDWTDHRELRFKRVDMYYDSERRASGDGGLS